MALHKFGEYTAIKRLGGGSFGTVYEAYKGDD